MGSGRWAVGAVGGGQWEVGSRRLAVGIGRWAVGAVGNESSGSWAVEGGQWEEGRGRCAEGGGQWGVGRGRWAMGRGALRAVVCVQEQYVAVDCNSDGCGWMDCKFCSAYHPTQLLMLACSSMLLPNVDLHCSSSPPLSTAHCCNAPHCTPPMLPAFPNHYALMLPTALAHCPCSLLLLTAAAA